MAHIVNFSIAAALAGYPPATGVLRSVVGPDMELSGDIFSQVEYTGDTNVDFTAIAGPLNQDREYATVTGVLIEIYKTAATSTGTVAIASTLLGFSSETVDMSDSAYTSQPVGACVWRLGRAALKTKAVTGSTDIALDFTAPVGFKVRITVVGNEA